MRYYNYHQTRISLFLLLLAGLVTCKTNNKNPLSPNSYSPPSKIYGINYISKNQRLGAVIIDSAANDIIAVFGQKKPDGTLKTIEHIDFWPKQGISSSFDISTQTYLPVSFTLSSIKGSINILPIQIDLISGKSIFDITDLSTNQKIVSNLSITLDEPTLSNLKQIQVLLKDNYNNGRIAVNCKLIEAALRVLSVVSCVQDAAMVGSAAAFATIVSAEAGGIAGPVVLFGGWKIIQPKCSSASSDAFSPLECRDYDPDRAANDGILGCLLDITKNRGRPGSGCAQSMAEYFGRQAENKLQNPPAHGTGEPHLLTLDGISYDFQGHGEFIATKSTVDNFEVQVRQEDVYKNGVVTANTSIAVQTGTDIVCATINPKRLFINKQPQDFANFTSASLKDEASVTKTKENGIDVLNITIKNGDLIKVVFPTVEYLDYYLYMPDNRKSKVIGLMGNFDGDKNNDIQTRSGENILINGSLAFDKLYPTYADSWRITQANSLFYYETGKSTDTYTQKDFPRTLQTLTAAQKASAESVCRAAGVTTEPFLSNCVFDVAITNNTALANSAFLAQKNASNVSSSPVTITPPSNQATIINFNDIKQIELKGNAKVVNGCIRLTEANYNIVGAAYYKSTVSGDFESQFTFKISELAGGGADGFTFLISKNIPELNIGEGLGYQGTKASLAVEFDTWQNTNLSDPNDNHISIHTNGQDVNSADEKYSIGINDKIINLSDGATHTIKIVYQNKVMEVFFDGKSAVKVSIDLNSKLGLNGSFYIGFTAATGGSTEIHDICSWNIKNL